jgi:murein tripeptide amidase MpaA
LSDLDRLLGAARGHPLVEVTPIGRTVEGRPLEILRLGRPDAPHRVLLRARAHPWEPGGNWVVEGLVRALLRDEPDNRRYLQRYAVYVMPLANKDGVARGMTRFNVLGKDLNRNWDRPADAQLAPENAALEAWLERMIADGRRPDLVIDLHNDEGGKLHVSRPAAGAADYLERMERLETLLRRHTWFTEGATGKDFRNPGSLGEGLLERYGITACVLELNCNWIAGLKKPPEAADWQQFGERLREVFFDYFDH